MAKNPEAADSVSARLDAIESRLEQILAALGGGVAPRAQTVIQLTDAEIDGISDALDRVGAGLSDRQQLYLLGIFGAAAHHLEGVAASEGVATENLRTITVANAANIRQVKLGDALAGLSKIEQGQIGGVTTPGGEVMDRSALGLAWPAWALTGPRIWARSTLALGAPIRPLPPLRPIR